MTSAALIGAGSAAAVAAGAGDEDGAAGDEDAGAGDEGEADVGGGAAVADGGAAAARTLDATSAHAPGKSEAIDERADRGTGGSYRKSRGTSRAKYLCVGQ